MRAARRPPHRLCQPRRHHVGRDHTSQLQARRTPHKANTPSVPPLIEDDPTAEGRGRPFGPCWHSCGVWFSFDALPNSARPRLPCKACLCSCGPACDKPSSPRSIPRGTAPQQTHADPAELGNCSCSRRACCSTALANRARSAARPSCNVHATSLLDGGTLCSAPRAQPLPHHVLAPQQTSRMLPIMKLFARGGEHSRVRREEVSRAGDTSSAAISPRTFAARKCPIRSARRTSNRIHWQCSTTPRSLKWTARRGTAAGLSGAEHYKLLFDDAEVLALFTHAANLLSAVPICRSSPCCRTSSARGFSSACAPRRALINSVPSRARLAPLCRPTACS